MGKELLIVEPHSFIDVITNSSSELFVCDTSKSLEFVKDYLRRALSLFNETYDGDYYGKFEDVFGRVEVVVDPKKWAQSEDADGYSGFYEDWGIKFEVGDIVIESASENSIPYALFGLIEETLNALRFHLG